MRLGKRRTRPNDSFQTDLRTSLHVPIMVLKADRDSGRTTFFGYAKNISRRGMMIGATRPREPGDQFLLEFSLPEPISRVVQCECEVIWKRRWARNGCHEPGMGLRFLDLPEELAEAIERWIRNEALQAQLQNTPSL